MNAKNESKFYVLKLESYEGRDTFLYCGNDTQDYLYCVVGFTEDGKLEIVDSSYRTVDEVLAAWPFAKPPSS